MLVQAWIFRRAIHLQSIGRASDVRYRVMSYDTCVVWGHDRGKTRKSVSGWWFGTYWEQ